MIIGFTGTAQGMTRAQMSTFYHKILRRSGLLIVQFHHGDCVGADEQAHNLVRKENPDIQIVGHPPKNPKQRAWCVCDVLMKEDDYIPRNHNIVDAVEEMVATPKGMKEELRSGTWATIRYTKKQGKALWIIWPNGVMTVGAYM